ncbi:PAC2 family protein [Oerskovia sp. M15]
MLDPRGIYEVDEAAVARVLPAATGVQGEALARAVGPVMLHSVRGFVDAGTAGDLAVEHLLAEFEVTRLVTFDVDQLLDYRSKRVTMVFDADRWASYDEPFLAIDHLRDAEGPASCSCTGWSPISSGSAWSSRCATS